MYMTEGWEIFFSNKTFWAEMDNRGWEIILLIDFQLDIVEEAIDKPEKIPRGM